MNVRHPISECKSHRVLLVQKHSIQQTYDIFKDSCDDKLESVVYWYGKSSLDENTDAVMTVAVPNARRSVVNYDVSAEAAAKMGRMMMEKSLVCLAQIHTHPTEHTAHSDYDDLNAISTRNGFLSLVVPYYGCKQDPKLNAVSVHEAWDKCWYRLTKTAKKQRIRIVEDVVDLRTGE